MADQDIPLQALNHLASVMESAALGYTGELKGELSSLCASIRLGQAGYAVSSFAVVLPELELALAEYRGGNYVGGASKLAAASRAAWQAVCLGHAP